MRNPTTDDWKLAVNNVCRKEKIFRSGRCCAPVALCVYFLKNLQED
ncbi:hypothetical protein D1AOALGA4SA_11861 [Olavius algarvensis Delta 1 endosymbiont]|nr:hypothetical protein D1AOALGA4SA_11861 [Olavius algarvensis Delta 1 endosymbiont]